MNLTWGPKGVKSPEGGQKKSEFEVKLGVKTLCKIVKHGVLRSKNISPKCETTIILPKNGQKMVGKWSGFPIVLGVISQLTIGNPGRGPPFMVYFLHARVLEKISHFTRITGDSVLKGGLSVFLFYNTTSILHYVTNTCFSKSFSS